MVRKSSHEGESSGVSVIPYSRRYSDTRAETAAVEVASRLHVVYAPADCSG